MKKNKFNYLLAAASTMAMVAGSQSVYAQTDGLEEVLVTGFRASLENSINAKRQATSIVDAVYAEDIGKLPDTSIAESLARLPGLAGERRDGRTSGIAIRGFNENYIATTLNGREVLGIGDSRGVEFDLYPSEMLSGVDVYKTPDATKMSQGLGGIVDMKTIRPLDSDRIISLSGAYEVNGLESANPDVDDNGHRLAFTYSDKFADDTVGVALTVATLESPSQEEQFRSWGYPEDQGAFVLGGHDSYVRSSVMERDTYSGVVQFRPNEKVTVSVDGLYIDFSETKVMRGLEEGTIWGGATSVHETIEDGLVTAGYWNGSHSIIRNDGEIKDGNLQAFGINVDVALTDTWTMNVDLSTSESEKSIINLESYSGVGRAGTATQGDAAARSFVMTPTGIKYSAHPTIAMPDYADASIIRLAGPQAWGGGISSIMNGFDNAQDGFVNAPSIDESLDAFRLQFAGEVDWGLVNGLEFGVHYSDRTKSKVNYGAFLVAPGFYQEDGSLPTDISQIGDKEIPSEFIVGTTDLSFLGLGSMIAYDGIGLYRSGLYTEIDSGNYETDRKGDTYSINEKVTTLFAMANLEVGQLTGNVGVQVVQSDQSAEGYDSVPVAPGADGTDGTVLAVAVSDGDKYTHVLPSLNLSYALTDEQNVRFAVAKTMSRAVIDDLKPGRTIGFTFDNSRRASDDPEFSAWSSTSGNARLKPIEAVQVDLAYEYYFARDGLVSIAGFYKDLQNWHLEGGELISFNDYFVPGYHDANMPNGETFASFEGSNTSTFEAGGGSVSGYEIQASVPFHLFSDWLDGFGITASATFLDSKLTHDGVSSDIPGFSKEIYQFTAYYERGGFEARISGRKRSDFLTEVPGLSLRATPAMDVGAELWDAQIGYNFSDSGIRGLEGLSVSLQAQNIFDEDTVNTESGDARRITKYQNFGANYLLGFNYKF